MSENTYSDIPQLIAIDRIGMTVGELIEALKDYPSDSWIYFSKSERRLPFTEIKDISSIIEMSTNKAIPIINLRQMKITNMTDIPEITDFDLPEHDPDELAAFEEYKKANCNKKKSTEP